MLSPGLTVKISPHCTSSTETVISFPFRIRVAFLGASSIRDLRAFVVLPLETDSSIFPTVIKVRIMPADSK